MTAAMPQQWPHINEEPDAAHGEVELSVVSAPPPRLPGWSLLLVFPLAVLLTVFAIGWPGRNVTGASTARVELRDASGSMGTGGRLADQLTAAGMTVVGVEKVGQPVGRTEIRYRGANGLSRAKAVRRVLGTGTIVRSPGAPGLADVTVFVGKDVQHE